MFKEIFSKGYMKALLLIGLAVVVLSSAQPSMMGLSPSDTFLGTIVATLVFVVYYRSFRRPVKLKAPVQPGSSEYYKKRLILILKAASPGLFFSVYTAIVTRNGGSEAAIVFIPLFLFSYAALVVAIIYGVIFLYKKNKNL